MPLNVGCQARLVTCQIGCQPLFFNSLASPVFMNSCLRMWLRVLFKQLFVPKYMSMIFFYFLKIIFDISTSKRSKKYKPHLILVKKKIQNLMKHIYKHNNKLCQFLLLICFTLYLPCFSTHIMLYLGLVCFQEFIFLETIFPTFPCLVSIRKIGQRKLNSQSMEKIKLQGRKMFSFLVSKENTFLFFTGKKCSLS